MIDADRPITSVQQDRLNRSVFAKYLARCLLDYKSTDSWVVGLEGGWGTGKTSIMNMVLEELNFASSNLLDEEKPVILNFNPWSYSGQNQLIYSFFRRLSSTLRHMPPLQHTDRIIYLLELYISFFTRQAAPKALQEKLPWWQRILGSQKEVFGWESGRDLTEVKRELNELLKQQEYKIIILIDNISRLENEEVRQMVQIIKSMGDYANTVYLLAFDQERVVSQLDQLGEDGTAVIEKLVQLPFNIPPILPQDLENIFADRLQPLITMVPYDAWNTEYWADIYYTSLRFFFENCRDITRYVNALNFGFPRLREVVNPVDFFALTAIEVFLPDVYLGIRDNKDLFSDLMDNVYELDAEQAQKQKTRCDEILSRNTRVLPERLLDLLIRLFPRLNHLYRPELPVYHSLQQARRWKRICSPDLFDAYFRLSVHANQLPKSEFDTILKLVSDGLLFDQVLTRLNQDERILIFINQLEGSEQLSSFPLQHIQSLITALLDNGDFFPPGIKGPLSLDTPLRIHRIIHALLKRFLQVQDRFMLLQAAIANSSKSLYSLVYEVNEQSREHNEEEDTFLPLEFRDLAPEHIDSLRHFVSSRIKLWADNGSLMDHPQLLPILYAWKEWGGEQDCERYVKQMTESDRGLLAFLLAVLENPVNQALTRYEKEEAWKKYLEDIEVFIPVTAIEQHAKDLFEDNYFEKLREKEQLALMIFLDLIHAETMKFIPQTTVEST